MMAEGRADAAVAVVRTWILAALMAMLSGE